MIPESGNRFSEEITLRQSRLHFRSSLIGAVTAGLLAALVTPASAAHPFRLSNAQMEPLTFAALNGWSDDDHKAAFTVFLQSCSAILNGTKAMRAARPFYGALFDVCTRATQAGTLDEENARKFFEDNFRPVRIAPLGDAGGNGFFTGYYEPVYDGSLTPHDEYNIPVYRKPASLVVSGRRRSTENFPSSGAKVGRLVARHKVVQFYDRASIEDGALVGRGLEICWLKNPVDAFFAQIQGSARIRVEDGKVLRLNYDAHNGLPYTPVGKYLIDRGIISKEEMSMDKIREWMEANPEEGKELRRKNRSFVFFRDTGQSDGEQCIGAQGVQLTPGRSLAVDKNIHVYGTPIWIDANLPVDSDKAETPFRRLMVAQDTGSAIVGPARADIFWGVGEEIGHVAGRIKQFGRFVMFVPKELDPASTGSDIPLPQPRPKTIPGDGLVTSSTPAAGKPAAEHAEEIANVPLPKPRPKAAPERT